ncbi:MAG TPA: membrane protein insertase YidC [Bacilli bacterium]|nr:membrane protein insertase YidC [Bacilli bacterium]HQC32512.1 membrane protein insertase YidC [Bacilli bacterium]
MKKSTKRILTFGGLFMAVVLISGCTASFCSNNDRANILYTYEKGVSVYEDNAVGGVEVFAGNATLTRRVPKEEDKYQNSALLQTVIDEAGTNAINVPTEAYFVAIDQEVLEVALTSQFGLSVDFTTVNAEQANLALTRFGYLKFAGYTEDNNLFETWDSWTAELRVSLGAEQVPNQDFTKLYKEKLNTTISTYRACIAVNNGNYGKYGSDGNTEAFIEGKSWAYAWSKGPIEGLLVYPVAFLVDYFSFTFGMNGWGQIGAVALVTLIVRTLILLTTIKSTMGQQKMQALQPELAKIQAKYPNSNTNQAEKQRLAQEQMALYKKNKINPLGQILVLIVQFPVFIAVWGAMTGAAVLSSDAVLGLNLSAGLGTSILNIAGWPNAAGWWTAVVLFVLMGISQFISMKLPQWMQKARTKNVKKLSKNPAQDKQSKQMKWFSNIMLVMIVVMGFSLPAAMGVYWFIGAIISVIQTLIMQTIMARSKK